MSRDPSPGAGPLAVFVPRDGTSARAAVAENSGVVGSPIGRGRLVIDYEANMHGAVNIRTFADKIHHAADRHRSVYPTRARTEVSEADLVRVGTYDGRSVSVDPGCEEALAAWLEIDPAALLGECRRS